jgi:serine/threonine protein kinase
MSLTAGTILGQYEIRSSLGAGRMSEVYRAHDTRLDRDVAIKVLPEYLTSNPERLRRFEQEARTTAALNHPNILAVFQMATETGVSYLVEELLERETLRERLRADPFLSARPSTTPCRPRTVWRQHTIGGLCIAT